MLTRTKTVEFAVEQLTGNVGVFVQHWTGDKVISEEGGGEHLLKRRYIG